MMWWTLFSWLIVGALCAFIAPQKGRRLWLWLGLGLVGGAVALVILLLLPDRKQNA